MMENGRLYILINMIITIHHNFKRTQINFLRKEDLFVKASPHREQNKMVNTETPCKSSRDAMYSHVEYFSLFPNVKPSGKLD
jgi:hypothetical protein